MWLSLKKHILLKYRINRISVIEKLLSIWSSTFSGSLCTHASTNNLFDLALFHIRTLTTMYTTRTYNVAIKFYKLRKKTFNYCLYIFNLFLSIVNNSRWHVSPITVTFTLYVFNLFGYRSTPPRISD